MAGIHLAGCQQSSRNRGTLRAAPDCWRRSTRKWMRPGEADDALGPAYRQAVNEAYLAVRSAVVRIAGRIVPGSVSDSLARRAGEAGITMGEAAFEWVPGPPDAGSGRSGRPWFGLGLPVLPAGDQQSRPFESRPARNEDRHAEGCQRVAEVTTAWELGEAPLWPGQQRMFLLRLTAEGVSGSRTEPNLAGASRPRPVTRTTSPGRPARSHRASRSAVIRRRSDAAGGAG